MPTDPSPQPAPAGRKPAPVYPVCACFQVYEAQIEAAVRTLGLTTVEEITRHTRAGGGCHTCWPELEEILARCARGEFKGGLRPARDARGTGRERGKG